MLEIKRNGYKVIVGDPTVYVDNEARFRSGHMSHAFAKFAPNKYIEFNSNCSAVRWDGHSPFGWIEYRISEDSGETYSEVYNLPYSVDSLLDGIYAISVETAVACDDGSIVAFCLRNYQGTYSSCEPWATPTYVRSFDGGKTWSDPQDFCGYKGRIYDSVYKDGVIYVVMTCNENWAGKTEDDLFRLFKSVDNGATFVEASIIPIDYLGRGYGSMIFDQKGDLHVYQLNEKALYDIDHCVSHDNGETWEKADTCYMDKGCNNPRIAFVDGVYLMHGRSAKVNGYVLYTSLDAIHWDEGTYIGTKRGLCYYSNHLNLTDKNGDNFLLLQYSELYGEPSDDFNVQRLAHNIYEGLHVERLGNARVNAMHNTIRIIKS